METPSITSEPSGREGRDRSCDGAQLAYGDGVHPDFSVSDNSGGHPVGIETHLFSNGGVTLLVC